MLSVDVTRVKDVVISSVCVNFITEAVTRPVNLSKSSDVTITARVMLMQYLQHIHSYNKRGLRYVHWCQIHNTHCKYLVYYTKLIYI